MGFPIRKSADQRLFAPPHGLSQRTTSFIASQRQGIHRIPLRHLIALIIDAHPLGRGRITFAMRGIDRKTICFKHIREHRGQALFTTGSPSSRTLAKLSFPHECRSPNLRSINDRICFLFTMTDSTHQALMRANANSVYPGFHYEPSAAPAIRPSGGARRDRTDDLMLAKHALSQLSYGPKLETQSRKRQRTQKWWAWEDLNFRPHAYQARALTN